MHTLADPPLWSANTIIATVMRAARGLGLALPAMRKIFGHMNADDAKAKVFRGYEPTEHDVFVATFPKSGTNWLMQMTTQIAWRGEAEFGAHPPAGCLARGPLLGDHAAARPGALAAKPHGPARHQDRHGGGLRAL